MKKEEKIYCPYCGIPMKMVESKKDYDTTDCPIEYTYGCQKHGYFSLKRNLMTEQKVFKGED